MKENKEEVKNEDCQQYDKAHSAVEPNWSEGDLVLLEDVKIKPRSDRVICHRPFKGPYHITRIVKGKDDIGKAYQLTDANTGQVYRYLVTADRLKRYTANKRLQLKGRLKKTDIDSQLHRVNSEEILDARADERQKTEKQRCIRGNDFEPAVKILREKGRGKNRKYEVLFVKGGRFWCDEVSELLLKNFRLEQARRRAVRKERQKLQRGGGGE